MVVHPRHRTLPIWSRCFYIPSPHSKRIYGHSGSIPDEVSKDMEELASPHGAPSLLLESKQRNSTSRASQEAARTHALS